MLESPAQVFSCEFCQIFKNTFIYRPPLVAASVVGNVVAPDDGNVETIVPSGVMDGANL